MIDVPRERTILSPSEELLKELSEGNIELLTNNNNNMSIDELQEFVKNKIDHYVPHVKLPEQIGPPDPYKIEPIEASNYEFEAKFIEDVTNLIYSKENPLNKHSFRRFFNFLKSEKVYSKFIDNYNEFISRCNNEEDFVINAFEFNRTSQGFEYWYKIHQDWCAYCKHENEKDLVLTKIIITSNFNNKPTFMTSNRKLSMGQLEELISEIEIFNDASEDNFVKIKKYETCLKVIDIKTSAPRGLAIDFDISKVEIFRNGKLYLIKNFKTKEDEKCLED